MDKGAKLIHKAKATYLPTAFPAHYYGMPNGKIYLVFSRFYSADIGNSGIEFVFAEHKDFKFDYDTGTIFPTRRRKAGRAFFSEDVDLPGSKFKIIKTNRSFRSYAEAQSFIYEKAEIM